MKRKLSKVLSKAIIQAVEDLELCMADATYIIDFTRFHEPIPLQFGGLKCSICFAGSVMAKSLGCNPAKEYSPDDFNSQTNKMLTALDHIRMSSIKTALYELNIDPPKDLKKFNVNEKNFTEFKQGMLEISAYLKSLKL